MIGLEQVTPAGQENTEPVVMPDDEVLYELADLFRVFGDSTRIKILYVLSESEMCVCDIAVLDHHLDIVADTTAVAFDQLGNSIPVARKVAIKQFLITYYLNVHTLLLI